MTTIENSFWYAWQRLGSIFQPERVFTIFLFTLGLASLILYFYGLFPLPGAYALFYFVLLFLLGVYRPQFLWQGVVFFLPFEILSVATLPGGFDIRFYQFGMAALALATGVLWLQQKVLVPTLRWFDWALGLVLIGGVLSLLCHGLIVDNLKDLLVLCSFALLYALGRVYLRKKSDMRIFLSTLLASASVVAGYALYQGVAFQKGWNHLMVMAGRPNSVFPEADWLGFFMGLAALVATIAFLSMRRWYAELLAALLFLLFVVTLILTVSRSAWLGMAGGLGVIGILLCSESMRGVMRKEKQDIRTAFKFFLGLPLLSGLAVGIILLFSLTDFDLTERLASTGGAQVITIACAPGHQPPEKVESITQLVGYGCLHINLEEIQKYQEEGALITQIERLDPNVAIRKSLYQDATILIKNNFFLGLGWGESVKAFGVDERGAGLNSSNIFLEVWLGSGLLGILGFLFFWFGILAALLNRLHRKREMTEGFWLSVLVLALWVEATIFNLFNAGIFLGVFMAFLSMAAWYGEKTVPYKLSSLFKGS